MKKEKTMPGLIRGILAFGGASAVVLCFASAFENLESGREAEDIRQLQEALRKSCVACYAAEGVYPPDLEYLKDHYGVQIDGERYTVYYERFAQNLMPEMTVLENKR